jgi:glycosyltransferase involved in cell wall biosynthesis
MTRALRPPITGIGRYTLNLVSHIGPALGTDSLVLFNMRGQKPIDGVRADTVESPLPSGQELVRLFWEQAIVPLSARQHKIDVYHSPNHVLPLTLACKSVVTVHDLGFLDRGLFNFRRYAYLNALTRPAIKKADLIICISEFTKRELETKFPSTRGKTRVVYQGLDDRFAFPPNENDVAEFKRDRGLGPFVLFIGAIEPRKNLARLIQAFGRAVQNENLPHELILCGPPGWRNDAVKKAWQSSPVRNRVRFMKYVPNEEVPLWYAAADALAFPSLSEGFGLPVLEAMACGTPVVTSDYSALPELAGDAAVLVSPRSAHSIADGLVKVLTDRPLAQDLSARGLERSRLFTWKTAADQTAAIYREALGA